MASEGKNRNTKGDKKILGGEDVEKVSGRGTCHVAYGGPGIFQDDEVSEFEEGLVSEESGECVNLLNEKSTGGLSPGNNTLEEEGANRVSGGSDISLSESNLTKYCLLAYGGPDLFHKHIEERESMERLIRKESNEDGE